MPRRRRSNDSDRDRYSNLWRVPTLRPERGPADSRRLLVLHVPKTGGSSLRKMLQAHVPTEDTFLSTGQHEWTSTPWTDLRSTTLFVGHHFLEPLYMFPDDDWVTSLALREPEAWWRSYYKYRRRPDRRGSSNDPSLQLSFEDYIASLPDRKLANPQSSWLLVRTRLGPAAAASAGRIVATPLTRGTGNPRRTLLALLRSVTALGTTDDLLGVYRQTCAAMGWQPRFTAAERDNVSPEEGEHLKLSRGQRKRLESLTRVDREAYDLARQRAADQPGPG